MLYPMSYLVSWVAMGADVGRGLTPAPDPRGTSMVLPGCAMGGPVAVEWQPWRAYGGPTGQLLNVAKCCSKLQGVSEKITTFADGSLKWGPLTL